MDTSKYSAAKADLKTGVTKSQAIRMEIADALRDLADEIEGGQRVVQMMQTLEQVTAGAPSVSMLTVQSCLTRVKT